MTDISLKASIDFRDAEKQVQTFVDNTKKSLASIMAAARAPGGSLAATRPPGGSPAVAVGGSSKGPTAGPQSLFNLQGAAKAREILKSIGQLDAVNYANAAKFRQALNALDERSRVSAMTGMRRLAEFENRQFNSQARLRSAAEAEDIRRTNAAIKRAETLARSQATASRTNIRTIGGAENNALGVSNRINRQLGDAPALQARLYGQLDSALKTYTGTVRQYGANSLEAARASVEWNRQMQNIRGTIAEKGGLLRTLNQNTNTLKDSIGGLGVSFGSLNRLMFNTQVVLSSLMAAFGLREVINSIQVFERFSNTLRTVSGTAGEFQTNMSFLFSEANRIGFSVGDVGNAFARLSVAMQGAGFSTTETRTAFTQLTEASRNFGLTSADTNGIIRALEQSMSKGKFMAEEVRLQMGDRLPIAMAALTRAVQEVDGGVVDINKRFEEGTLDVTRYAAAFVRAINDMSGGSAALDRTSTGLTAAFGRVSTEFLNFSNALGAGGLTDATITVTENLRNLMVVARESGGLDVLGGSLKVLAENTNVLGAALIGLAAIFSARLVAGVVAFAAAANPVVKIISAFVAAAALVAPALDRAFSNQRNFNEFGNALRGINTAQDTVNATVSQFEQVLTRSTTTLNSSSTAVDRRVIALQRLGETEAEATAIAAREAAERMRITIREQEAALTRAQAAQSQINRGIVGRAGRGIVGTVSEIETALQEDPRNPRRLTAESRAALEETLNLYRRASPIILEFTNGTLRAEEAVQKLNDEFRGQTMPAEIDAIRKAINEASIGPQFQEMEGRMKGAAEAVKATRTELENLESRFADGITVRFFMEQVRTEIAEGEALGTRNRGQSLTQVARTAAESISRNPTPAAAATVARSFIQTTQLNAPRNPDDPNSGRFGNLAAMSDANLVRLLRTNQAFIDTAPDVARALGTVTIAAERTGTATDGARNSVEEFMRDLRLSATASEAATGAERAHADALKRLEDAAKNARGGIVTETQAREVALLVQRTLNNARDNAIKAMDRETDQTNRVAEAYTRGTAAGLAAEAATQAQAQAHDFARANSVDYTTAVELLTAALQRQQAAQANNRAARDIAGMREEQGLLRLEGTLISANTNLREEELAVARALQTARGATPEMREQVAQTTRETVRLRQNNQQLENSWSELSKVGEQAFERIGNAVTEAFAQGKIEAIDFKNIAKAVFSEVIQAGLRMSVINPVLNSVFGGNRGTLGGAFTAAGSGGFLGLRGGGTMGGAAGLANAGSSAEAMNTAGQALALRQAGGYGNLGNAFTGNGLANTGYGWLDGALNTSLVSPTLTNTGTFAANAGSGGFFQGASMAGEAGAYAGSGAGSAANLPVMGGTPGLTAAGAIGGAASIAGGAYGIYSGIQKGGIGGAVGAAGGAAGVGLGLASLGALGPAAMGFAAALGPVGWAALAALAIAGALLPGEKASGKGQLARMNLDTENLSFEGLGGKRFSQDNRDSASNSVARIADLAKQVGDKLGGARIGGNVAVGVTSSRDGKGAGDLYLEIGTQKGRYSNDEAGSKQLADAASQMILNEFKGQGRATGDFAGILGGSNTLEELDANLNWYEQVYKALTKSTEQTSQFAQQLEAAAKPYDEAINKARKLSLAEDELVKKRDEAVAAVQKQRDLQLRGIDATLATRGGAMGGADFLALQREQATIAAAQELDQLRETLLNLGLTTAEVTARVEKLAGIQAAEAAKAERERVLNLDGYLGSLELRANGDVKGAERLTMQKGFRDEITQTENDLRNLGASSEQVANALGYLAKIQLKTAADFESAGEVIAAVKDQLGINSSALDLLGRASDAGMTVDRKWLEESRAAIQAERDMNSLRESLIQMGATALEVAAQTELLRVVQQEEVKKRERDRLNDNFLEAQSAYISALDEEISKREEATQSARANAEAMKSAAEGLREYTRSLRLDSNVSPLTMIQRLEESRTQYTALMAQARSGTPEERAEAARKLQGIAGTRLGLSSGFFAPGTQAYVAEFNDITTGLDALADQFGMSASVEELSLKAQESSLAVLREQRDQAAQTGAAVLKSLDELRQAFLAAAAAAGIKVPTGTKGGTGGGAWPWQNIADTRPMGNFGVAASGEAIFGGQVTAGEQLNASNINALYQQFLGRDAEAGVLEQWQAFGGRGFDLAAALEQSTEFQTRLAAVQAGRAFANGGMVTPGLALVGEQGPELVHFNQPGYVYTAQQTSQMMGGGLSDEAVDQIKELLQAILTVSAQGSMAIVGAVSEQTEVIEDSTTTKMAVPA